MLLQFPLLRNNALKNATCRQNEPFNEHQDLLEQFRQMMFQVDPRKGEKIKKFPRELMAAPAGSSWGKKNGNAH